jgi:2-keto-3-deoxy-L-rhamnonate aldolase RhmA
MSMRSLTLKQRLRAGDYTFGAWVSFSDPAAVEIMAGVGFDWIFVDTEHAPFSLPSLHAVLMAFDGRETVPIVRVPWNDHVAIKQVLDLGAEGIVVPMVMSSEDARRAVAACRYPPQGIRGFGPRRASDYYRRTEEYIQTANESVIVVVQIEHMDAIGRIDEILDVPGIDVVCLGPMDLSGSMGLLGRLSHPRVHEAIETVLEVSRRRGFPVAVPMETSPADQLRWAVAGARFVVVGEDHGLLRRAATEALTLFRSAVRTGGRKAGDA